MAIYGALGEVERIACTADPKTEIIGNGEVCFNLIPVEQGGRRVAENCPRNVNFDTSKELGCVSCTYAFIDYANHGIADC